VKNRIRTLLAAGIVLLALAPSAASAAAYTERISVTSSELEATGGDSLDAAISTDGAFVAFSSAATDLVPSDTNGNADIFVRDRANGTTERVSIDSSEAQATGGDSLYPSISADGRFVAFSSEATNLVSGDSNTTADIFVRDRTNGTTERVSVDSSEAEATQGNSEQSSMSADGRYIAFESFAVDLVPGDTGGLQDIFVRDRTSGTTERVSVSSAEEQGVGGGNSGPSISADGNLVAFATGTTNLVTPDANANVADIVVRNRSAGTTELVHLSSNEVQGNFQSLGAPAFSGDGRYVAFQSSADNLVPGDDNPGDNLFLRDMQLGTTEIVSLNDAEELPLGGGGGNPSVSTDGRFVAFETPAYNLVAGDDNGKSDIFVRDRLLGTIERSSVTTSGEQSSNQSPGSYNPSINGDGGVVVFDAIAPDLVSDDTNANADVFVHAYDIDFDGVSDFSDNCPTVANTNGQAADQDGDIAGDACDAPGTGNADCNQAISSIDALKILRFSAALSVTQSEPCKDVGEVIGSGFKQGDVDCNGSINSIDALKILRAVALLSVSTGCSGPVIGP
jgi:Tol biopolymer transport system component